MNFGLLNKIGSSKFFIWMDAIYLPRWDIYAIPKKTAIVEEIEKTALKMDLIRTWLNRPIYVTSWFRPEKYNSEIGGVKASKHIMGQAVDFSVKGLLANEVRELLKPRLIEFNIRMEDLPNSNWVHIDTACNVSDDLEKRFFKP